MLLALCLLQLTVLTVANPFHKYPYVFLLDVGNEELEKVNTEQIRISKQGGSLALRYPAIGNGEDIAHVRVSGIDFGTDLKANIVDGGPGYKYVVLVLMGNPGVNFDAVVTIQTVPSESDEVNLQNIDNSSSNIHQDSGDIDPNDSAEDVSDSAESEKASQVSIKESAELTQESSNVYSYAVNEALNGYGNNVHSNVNDVNEDGDEDDDDEDGDEDGGEDGDEDNSESDEGYSQQQDIHTPYKENPIQVEEQNSEFDDYANDGDSSGLIENKSKESHDNDDYSSVIDDQHYANDDRNQQQVKTDIYEQYEAFRQSKYGEGEFYPQSPQRFIPDDSGTVYVEEPGDNDGPLDLEEIFGTEYDDADDRQYSDKNNNNFMDRSDGSAVAY